MKFQRNISLKNYTTFKIGGKADYFISAKNEKDIIDAVKEARQKNLPFLVLGKGSNVLIPDKGFEGLVIKMDTNELKIKKNKVFIDAGVSLSFLVNKTAEASLSGLEWAVGIPGTIGGAVFGNAGSFNGSMKDNVFEVKVFDVKKEKVLTFKNKDCKFSYRKSIFKNKNNFIIISIVLNLKKSSKIKINNLIKDHLNYKKNIQPLNYPSAGSVFKNPECFSAAELIEKCNLKGKIIGGARISEKHANFIINFKNAKYIDVKKLISLIKNTVKNKFNIDLEEEIIIF